MFLASMSAGSNLRTPSGSSYAHATPISSPRSSSLSHTPTPTTTPISAPVTERTSIRTVVSMAMTATAGATVVSTTVSASSSNDHLHIQHRKQQQQQEQLPPQPENGTTLPMATTFGHIDRKRATSFKHQQKPPLERGLSAQSSLRIHKNAVISRLI